MTQQDKPQTGHSYHIVDNQFIYHDLGTTLFGLVTNETSNHYHVFDPITQKTYTIPIETDRFTFHRNINSAIRYTIDYQTRHNQSDEASHLT